MLLQIEIPPIKTDPWTIDYETVIVAQVTGYKRNELSEHWSLSQVPSFVSQITNFATLELIRNIGSSEFYLGFSDAELTDDYFIDGIFPVTKVIEVNDFPKIGF